MGSNMETEVRATREGVLRSTPWKPPGAVIHDAILAGNKSAYRSTGLLAPYGAWEEKACRWSQISLAKEEERSLIPCMTAIAIKYLRLGGFYKGQKHTQPKKSHN